MAEEKQIPGTTPLDEGLEPPNASDHNAEALAVESGKQQPAARRGRRLLKRALGLIVVAVILAVLGNNLAKSWNTLAGYHWQASVPLLALAFLGFVAQTLSYPLVWRFVLRRLGYSLSLPKSMRIYLASEFVRYLPGNVWHVITRILWAEREGIPKPIGFVSMTVELVTKIASAALVFAVTLLFWPRIDVLGSAIGGQTIVFIGLAAIPVVLGLMQPRLLAWLLNRALKLMRKPAITLPIRYRDVLFAVLCWCGSWAIGGVAFYLLVVGVAGNSAASGPLLTLLLSIGIASLGWDIGFLSFITPSGLGFREAATALLLTLSMVVPGIALATVIAFLWRILSTLAELLCVGGAHLIVSRMERAPETEPTTGYAREVSAMVD